jgi:hypothetical protein
MKQFFLTFLMAAGAILASFFGHEELAAAPAQEEKNPHAIFFEAEKLKDTHIDPIGPVATFRLIVRNAIPDQKYILSSQNVGGPVKPLYEYEADDEGQLGRQLQDGTMMMDNDILLMFDFFKGESVQYFLESKDGSTHLKTTVIPYPIRAEGRNGAEVTLRRLTPDAKLMICEGDGFLPDEEIFISSQSARMRTTNIPFTCENGQFSVILEPQVSGKTGGLAYVDIRRAGERMILEYDWGCQALNLKRREADSTKMKLDAISKIPTDLDG